MDLYTFDDNYVTRLREGDRVTEEHFVRYFSELLLIKLRRRLPSRHAIDDVRQEVFVRVSRTCAAKGSAMAASSPRSSTPSAVRVLLHRARERFGSEYL